MKQVILLILGLLIGIGTAQWAGAQIQAHHDGFPKFSADYVGFKGDDSHSYLELYTQISFKDLSFVRQENYFRASYEIEATIKAEGEVVRQRTFVDTVIVHEFNRTLAGNEYRITVQGFILPAGDYEVVLTMTDQETRRSVTQELPVTLRDFSGDALAVSDIEFARKIVMCEDSENPFVKNGRFVEPNVSRAYGYLATSIYLYYEIYGVQQEDSEGPGTLLVTYRILTLDGQLKKQVQKRTRKLANSCVHSVIIPVADLESGRYVMEIEVQDMHRPDEVARVQKEFVVGWDFLSFGDYTSMELIDQLELIANEQEIASLRKLPEQYRRAGILSFWKSKDPTPDTELNELMIEFYRRVSYANKKFRTPEKKGWETDQGKIYIKYGPPDSIERYLAGGMNKPYEVWQYLNPRRKFVFIDNRGFGNYQLYTEAGIQAK
ncbi:MAG: GWxTD domain-containing protein [candidate division KSB1 bacterium]|nr:GWxTD domain-containing protein [candidate division KSB1 bacterium]